VTIPPTTKKAGARYTFSLTAVGPNGKRARAVKTVVTEVSATIPTTISGTITAPLSEVWSNSISGTFTFVLDPTSSACSLTGECNYDLVDLQATMTGTDLGPECQGLTISAPVWNGASPSGSIYLGPLEPAKNRYITMSFGATAWIPNCTFSTQFNHATDDILWTPGVASLSMSNEDPGIGSSQLEFQYS
jgi:hypothetical protein